MKPENYQVTIQYKPNDINKVYIGSNTHDPWMDLGILIEGLGTMMAINRKQKDWGKAQMFDYVKDYLAKVAMDYNKSETIN